MKTDKEYMLPVFGIERHRMHTDGIGVTTLVGTYGCPLSCKYCINTYAKDTNILEKVRYYTAQELYDVLKKDELYFLATGGGVVFGGGEPLLHAHFYKEFKELCKNKWRLTVETSLNIDLQVVEESIDIFEDYIIDIKDMDPKIYKNYTLMDNNRVIENLRFLLSKVSTANICVRVPHIYDYNTNEDVKRSIRFLKKMGIELIDEFTYIKM